MFVRRNLSQEKMKFLLKISQSPGIISSSTFSKKRAQKKKLQDQKPTKQGTTIQKSKRKPSKENIVSNESEIPTEKTLKR